MSKNGMATYGKTPGYINLTHMPTPKRENVLTFQNMTGGLNIYDLNYMLKPSESPDMVNMRWKDGAMGSRKGQIWRENTSTRGVGHAAYERDYYGSAFFHIGTKIYSLDMTNPDSTMAVVADIGTNYRGTFIRYFDDLLYKAPGVYYRIRWNGSAFVGTDLTTVAYVPVTYINADARNGSGDSYQPENRISPQKTIWYNASTTDEVKTFTTASGTTDYTFSAPQTTSLLMAYLDGVLLTEGIEYSFDRSTGTISLVDDPGAGRTLACNIKVANQNYYLPVQDANTKITEIKILGSNGAWTTFDTSDGVPNTDPAWPAVDPTLWDSAWDAYDYIFYPTTGHLMLKNAAYVFYPIINNTVRVTYSLANTDAYNSIMGCPYAIVYGGSKDLCVVVGGCTAQPNAYFWNGNNVAMDPTYFPMDQYNLGGETEDPITGFGKQQAMLVIFKENSIGRAVMGTQQVGDRMYISMDYTPVNAATGCDLPWTIQLIENNLVFCNTKQGIHYLKDSSAAYENNVITLSKKVNGTQDRVGIVQKTRNKDRNVVVAFDDDERYWLVIDDEVYVWDYILSDQHDPSFFYFTNIQARALMKYDNVIYHINQKGQLTEFQDSYCDYDQPIYKKYVFPTQFFQTYDRLKDVTRVILSVKTTKVDDTILTYMNDWENRDDLTPVQAYSFSLSPRNLSERDLTVTRYGTVVIRRPGCRHVRHFAMMLENNTIYSDMNVIFAQIFYKFQGRDR